MRIETEFTNGIIPARFGKNADKEDIRAGNPVRSFPFSIKSVPVGTKTFALSLIDYDAVPICSFPWIHWLAANIPAELVKIPENFSLTYREPTIQGKNSFSSQLSENDFSEIENLFVGPTPPDQDHCYTLTVYALPSELDLQPGYCLNEFFKESEASSASNS
ncbi:YbhB/YbcL family Raf kinase inhibitor-like protein [Candidatus Enterococcus moelleringii]|uniref:YbhB/YbcL family Raf kinase inhibitor-like protein n=1 Tax=Candidatus Enterococcus moelleringii TaxID=2815325 RepID=UPI00325BD322